MTTVDTSVLRAPALLATFNAAGVLEASDVHVAQTLGRLLDEPDEAVLLAAALAARAPRRGDVCADLADARTAAAARREDAAPLDDLPWPDPADWVAAVGTSPLVAPGDGRRPLRLEGTLLYLDRYWRYERLVAADLRRRAAAEPDVVDEAALAVGIDRLLPATGDDGDLQRTAAETAVRRRFSVVAGGPGTGKTRTVAAVLALLDGQAAAAGTRPPRVALAAPTGKAAARLTEAVRDAADALDVDAGVAARLRAHEASTVHRLLGSRGRGRTRFRHHAGNPLPHDVVVVDESSMVPLAMMAKLLDALRGDARLVLLGDPDQLEAVEAGAVLGDVVAPARGNVEPASAPLRDSIVVLRRVHRFDPASGIAAAAAAIQRGDADALLAVLAERRDDLDWIDAAPEPSGPAWRGSSAPALATVRDAVARAGGRVLAAAAEGRAVDGLDALGDLRILCTHRRGPFGVDTWVGLAEHWLAADVAGYEPVATWYLGRPVLVTENDYTLGVFNGDTGLVVAGEDGRLTMAFRAGEGVRTISPTRLDAVDTVHAMTVHKSQGSQFGHVVVVLADPASPILTRELLYTAVTRAQDRLTIIGTADAVRAAVARPAHRVSGLRDALWA